MDPIKVKAVSQCPEPENRRQLHFLRFTNFYQRFVRGYSSTATSLHLTSVKENKVGPVLQHKLFSAQESLLLCTSPDPPRSNKNIHGGS